MTSLTSTILERLPAEVRLQILKYLLPHHDRVLYSAYTCSVWSGHGQIYNGWMDYHRTPAGERATRGILMANRQLHAEACALLQLRKFVPHEILINDDSLYQSNPENMMTDVNNNIIPEWNDVFTDTDLGKVKELSITITPQEFSGFWPCLAAALESLCKDVLSRRNLPKRMTINLCDMRTCFHLHHTYEDARLVKACLADYKAALEPFQALACKIESFQINLPYWMEFATGMANMREELRDKMNAHIMFMPLDPGTFRKVSRESPDIEWENLPFRLEDGAPVRSIGWPVADLAEMELENSKRGLRERFASKGSWA